MARRESTGTSGAASGGAASGGAGAAGAGTASSAVGGGAERILQAAIALFGENGVNGTSLKAIAARAGGSPALILHHYGSKEGLRTACDQWVATSLRTIKTEAIAEGRNLDPLAVASSFEEHRPMMRYLARTLTDGSPHVNELVDELVAGSACEWFHWFAPVWWWSCAWWRGLVWGRFMRRRRGVIAGRGVRRREIGRASCRERV